MEHKKGRANADSLSRGIPPKEVLHIGEEGENVIENVIERSESIKTPADLKLI